MASIDPAVVSNRVAVVKVGPRMSVNDGWFLVAASLPPTLNQSYHSYPVGGHCRMVMAKAAREWKEEVALHVRGFWNASDHPAPKRAIYSIRMTQYLTRNSRDADSNIKLVMDAIFNGMGVNDNRVFKIVLDKVVDKGESPRIVVVVDWDV